MAFLVCSRALWNSENRDKKGGDSVSVIMCADARRRVIPEVDPELK